MSVEAAIVGILVTGLLLVASSPFGSSGDSTSARLTTIFSFLAGNVFFAVVTLLKGKFILGALAVFFSPLGWVGSLRLAKPYSPWAHWFYASARGSPGRRARRERKLARATKRFEAGRLGQFERWLVDLIGGKLDAAAPAGARVNRIE